jgi:hypothetical protein
MMGRYRQRSQDPEDPPILHMKPGGGAHEESPKEFSIQNLFMILLPVAAVYLAWEWSRSRSRAIIDRWSKQHGYEVLSAAPRLWRGPFLLRSGHGHTVYRVTVKDASGTARSGWVRCGSWLLGLVSDEITVEWDD